MRIMFTVLDEHGDRDVVVELDDSVTVARVAEALGDPEPLAKVVKLPRSRAPYGMSPAPPYQGRGRPRIPEQRAPERGDGLGQEGPTLWREGRPVDSRALAKAVLRDGDRITLSRRLARATVTEEPVGVAEVRVVGGPGAGAVHRLSLGAHVIGSDAMCAIAVPDPVLAPEAATLRITPEAITVEPVRRERPAGPPRRKIKGRYAEELTELAERDERREADRWAEAERARYGAPAADLSAAWPGGPPELDGKPLADAADWPEHALLTCGSSVFTLTAVEPRDAHLAPAADGGVAYNRPPRLRRPEPERRFEQPAKPHKTEGLRLQLLAAFLPAVLGVVLALVLRQWYFLLIALMTPLIMIGQWWSDRRHGKKQHRQALREYQQRLDDYDRAVEQARAADERARRADAPDPAEVLLTATGPRRRLWERRIHDPDTLRLRVGLADLPANLELVEESGGAIEPPLCASVPVALAMRRLGVAGVTGPRDTATALTGWLIAQAATLHSPRDLAVVVLSAHADGEARWSWVRWLPHCAPRGGEDCVSLVGTDPDSAAHRVAELAALIDERQNTAIPELGKVPTGWDDLGGPEPPAYTTYDERPYDVLVVLDGAQALRGLPGMPQVLRQGPRAGVYTLALDDDQRLLPEECATVAACGADGLVRLRGGGLDAIGTVLTDQVSPTWCDHLARSLAPIRDVSRDDPSGALPESVRLLDLIGMRAPAAHDVMSAWRDPGSTRAVLGVGPDGPFTIDLRVDGPHGLVAGTTGAGKSELLQSLICSLAVANRPDQLSFVLIDYKGGAAFKECARLPHTVGMVSDLDGHLTQRALDSLGAEIRRRERLLLEAGAKDLDDYTEARDAQLASAGGPGMGGPSPATGSGADGRQAGGSPHAGDAAAGSGPRGASDPRLARSSPAADPRMARPYTSSVHPPGGGRLPRLRALADQHDAIAGPGAPVLRAAGPEPALPALPRLVLIIDEFAALVAELPDFVTGLVDIARRGRSLGIHLILATQRPAGVVTADIQANTSLRIALRVTEPNESADVIDMPDAAHIPKSAPGRCYVKSGAGAAVAVQTGRVGGRARDDDSGRRTVTVVDLDWHTLGKPLPRPPEPAETSPVTDLTLLADALTEAATLAGVPHQPSPWLDPLPAQLVLPLPSPGSGAGSPAAGDGSGSASSTLTGSDGFGPGESEDGTHGPQSGTRGPESEARRTESKARGSESEARGSESEARGAESWAGVREVGPLEFGTTDRPWAQDRRPFVLDLVHGGHLLIAGSARSGRSTALRTIAGAIAAHTSPADVHVHAVDCGSGTLLPLVAMPHCGAVVTRDQLDRVERLLARLRAEVGRRQQLLAEAGHSSLAEYRRAGHRLPWMVLMLDRWEGYVAAFEAYDYGRLTEAVLQLLREGPAVGLRAVVTGDRSSLLGQISTVFDDRLILRLADPSDYALAGLPVKHLPAVMPPGRAVSTGEHGIVETQIALLADDPSGQAQVAALQSLSRSAPKLTSVPEALRPLRVDALPMRITADQTMALTPSYTPPSPLWALLGAGGDALAPLGIDLMAQGPAAVVAGPPRSGRSSALLTAAHSLISRGTPVIAIVPRRSPLRDLEGALAILDGNGTGLSDLVAGLSQYVVIVDDAELINPDAPLGMALDDILRTGRDGDHALIIAGATGDLATSYRGFIAEARKARTGLLLSVQSPADGDLFTVRLPRGAVGGPPGRGLLVTMGTTIPIQTALPT
ncbi:FtsK/SpoIIIE domain-containing protein [Nonomuraea typhae]|uniref:FtsK/SpoIIIE domain-containing protein n=1 Tax=Nonomuraea typhae TaxID=2603600 RepID=UPI001FE78D6D|nr:FtsK/SpoIIIE domain-containing protein [Nonomuraea typhae]